MKPKEKIKIIATLLNAYLETIKGKTSFYYAGRNDLETYRRFLNDEHLDQEEIELIHEALGFKKVKFGKVEYDFGGK